MDDSPLNGLLASSLRPWAQIVMSTIDQLSPKPSVSYTAEAREALEAVTAAQALVAALKESGGDDEEALGDLARATPVD